MHSQVDCASLPDGESQREVNRSCEMIFLVHREEHLRKAGLFCLVQSFDQHGATQPFSAEFRHNSKVIHLARRQIEVRIDEHEADVAARVLESQPESRVELSAGAMHGQCIVAGDGAAEFRTIETADACLFEQVHEAGVFGRRVQMALPRDIARRGNGLVERTGEEFEPGQVWKAVAREGASPGDVVLFEQGLTDGDAGRVELSTAFGQQDIDHSVSLIARRDYRRPDEGRSTWTELREQSSRRLAVLFSKEHDVVGIALSVRAQCFANPQCAVRRREVCKQNREGPCALHGCVGSVDGDHGRRQQPGPHGGASDSGQLPAIGSSAR